MSIRQYGMAKIAGCALAAAALATVASASPAVNLTTPGELYGSDQYTLGFQFTVSADQTITALGVFDDGVALPADAMVGIWDSSGDLLASVTVPASGSTQIGDFAYASISAFALTPGTNYFVGAFEGDPTGIASSLNTGQGGTGSFNSAITVIQDQFSDFDDAFSFPGTSDGVAGGAWLGANFLLAAPEPATWAMMLVGFAGLGAAMRRRRHFAAA